MAAEQRASNGVHMAQNGMHWHNEGMLATATPTGMVKVLHTELFADPTSPYLITGGSADNANWYGKLRQYGPRLFIVVRMYHPAWWTLDPVAYAEYTVRLLSRWTGHGYPDANLWQDPYVGVVLANEQNIEQPDVAAVSWYSLPGATTAEKVAESVKRYKAIAEWNRKAWERIDQLVPDRKALAVWSALAEGHDSQPDQPESEYQIPELRAVIERMDVLNCHPYAHKQAGRVRPDAPGEAGEYWGMLRPFRPAGYRDTREQGKPHDIGGVLGLFPGMPFIFGELGTFAHDRPELAADNLAAIRALWQKAAATGRSLGGAVYIWHGGEDHRANVIMHSQPMREGLAAMGPIAAPATFPAARPGRGYGGGTPMANLTDKVVALLRQRLGTRFVDARERYQSNYGYADSRTMRYIVVHHSASSRDTSLDVIETEHKGRGWAGIGYHAVIRRGVLTLVSNLDVERAHTYGKNRDGLGICITGNYAYGEVPQAEDLGPLREFIRAVDEAYGHTKEVVGHSQAAEQGHGTACPGNALLVLLPTIRTAAGGGADGMATTEAAIEAALEAEHRVRGLRFNPTAGLWREAGVPSGYLPSTNEIDIDVAGTAYVGQRYENGQQARDRLYVYAPKAGGAIRKFARKG